MAINIANYTNLSKYALLAGSGITTVNDTIVGNGYYGSSPTASYTGTFVPYGSPSGLGSDASSAQDQLNTLIGDINTLTASLPRTTISTTYGAFPLTFYPNTNYVSGSAITFTGTTIILDAQGDSNAQFFITAGTAISFTNVKSITLINGGTNCNVFWLAQTAAITFGGTSPSSIPGIFIANTAVTFANSSQLLGRVYAKTASITFSGPSSINAICGASNSGGNVPVLPIIPISNICFLGHTPITTDQGNIQIKNINPDIHTINNEKIVAITKTIPHTDYLVCFDKNSIHNNYPNQKTVMSKNHKIFYKGEMIEAYKFLKHFKHVTKVKYNGETLYNILLKDYTKIAVNGLICETLHPENVIAKIYTIKSLQNRNIVIRELNDCILKKDYSNYVKVAKKINNM
jgi:hypothetical protein